jgi:hypothetical protein
MWAKMGIRYDIVYVVKELSQVLQDPTTIAQEILARTLTYLTQTADAYLEYNQETTMYNFTLPPTRKKPGQQPTHYDVKDYNPDDNLPHHDDHETPHNYIYIGKQCIITCYTDIDLAGQHETRQSTSGYLLFINGFLIHWHGRTERVIIASTAAGEYIALSRGHAACKFLKTIMQFYGHIDVKAYLYTDNQSAEHIATQPNMNEHSRNIDIRHHAVRQDYLEGNVDVGGVRTDANPSDILTKYLPTHARYLNITIQPPSSPTTIYTQNGNFINTENHEKGTNRDIPYQGRTNPIRPRTESRRLIADGRNGIHRNGPSHIRPRLLLHTCFYPPQQHTKRQKQKQRQRYWNHIHHLRNLNPQLSINPKAHTQHARTRTRKAVARRNRINRSTARVHTLTLRKYRRLRIILRNTLESAASDAPTGHNANCTRAIPTKRSSITISHRHLDITYHRPPRSQKHNASR